MELAIATEHFSNNVILGEGGFGQVYKGFIDGKLYAVKKLKNQPDEQTQATMEEEIRVISRVRHRNLVELIGYCIQGNNRLLVLEFLSNKSLKFHLHGKPTIIHRDIKADNIVLDENFEPKVTDFGLSLFFPENVTHISKSIKGTEVYVDPDCSGKVSYKSDVYSFGVVLLELITGKKPMIGDTTIVNWAKARIRPALEGDYKALVDSKLSQYDKEEMNRMIFCAAACLYKPLKSRPSMGQIIQILEAVVPLKHIWDENDHNYLNGIIFTNKNYY
uniref:non-specific serine/threonine protein kinase n=1 Tax=Manihot esculenta TaxID=3983 RepID=A0A2C9W4I8_MANES